MEARIDAETRRRMIAEAAYFRAEQRGFTGGDPLTDWIAAEAEVDAVLRDGDHGELLARIEDRVAEAGKKVEALRRKAGSAASDARSDVQQELARITEIRQALVARGDEIREQGAQTSRTLLEQAESLWKELTDILGRKKSAPRRGSTRRK